MLRSADIVEREDFMLGSVEVSPSRRQLNGPAGSENLEPRVMQVLICLSDKAGKVVTRSELFEACWGGVPVGDDSMNRAVAKLRRALDLVAPQEIEIETIPRTGYRLHGRGIEAADEAETQGIARRQLVLGGGAMLLAGTVGGLAYITRRSGTDTGAAATHALDDADKLMREWIYGNDDRAEQLVKGVLERHPDNARAWGQLALIHRRRAEREGVDNVQAHVAAGKAAADRALRLDPKESNALTARATLQPEFGNWGVVERDLRAILEIDPANYHAKVALVVLMQEVGRARESLALNEELVAVDPLAPTAQYRRALKHWIFGRPDQGALTINRVLQSYPQYSLLWFGRFYIYMFGGRASDALRILDDEKNLPESVPLEARSLFRAIASAIDTRGSAEIDAARRMMLKLAPEANAYAMISMMALSELGLLDEAFDVAHARLLRRGPLAGRMWAGERDPDLPDHHWVRTMNLFTPPTRSFRLDPRFATLARDIGLERYWRDAGVGPDAFLMR